MPSGQKPYQGQSSQRHSATVEAGWPSVPEASRSSRGGTVKGELQVVIGSRGPADGRSSGPQGCRLLPTSPRSAASCQRLWESGALRPGLRDPLERDGQFGPCASIKAHGVVEVGCGADRVVEQVWTMRGSSPRPMPLAARGSLVIAHPGIVHGRKGGGPPRIARPVDRRRLISGPYRKAGRARCWRPNGSFDRIEPARPDGERSAEAVAAVDRAG